MATCNASGCQNPLPDQSGKRGRRAKFCSRACRQRAYALRSMSAPVVPFGQTVKDKDRVTIDQVSRSRAAFFIADVDDSVAGRRFAHDQLDLMLNVLGKFRHEGGA